MTLDRDPYDEEIDLTVEEIQQRAAQEEKEKAEDFRWLMGEARGRRFIRRLLVQAGLYRTSYRPDSTAEQMFFREGCKQIAYLLKAEIDSYCPNQYNLMQREHRKRHERTGSNDE